MRHLRAASMFLVVLLLVLLAGMPLRAQNTITTVAGGGPNNIPALSASIGFPYCGVSSDRAGNFYFADCISRIFKVDATGLLTVAVGNRGQGYSGDGGPASDAELSSPSGIFVDKLGNIFIADSRNNRIREIVAATGIIQTVAGNGTSGYSGDGGAATSAELAFPKVVSVDQTGNVFIVDTDNMRIREVVAATGIIMTVAGNGTQGYSGDGGPATKAQFWMPMGISLDGFGNIFIADTGNSRIREVVAATGIIQTVAGNGTYGYSGDSGPATSAGLNSPGGVFVDQAGNIFIADTWNNRIREVVAATGIIQTVAGNGTQGYSGDGGPATKAQFWMPMGISLDGFGNIFIADTDNYRIREVVEATGIIQTVAGNGTQSYSGDGGPATEAVLSSISVAVDTGGDVFIGDAGNSRLREVVAQTGIIHTIAGTGISAYSGDGGPAASSELQRIEGISIDNLGNLFIADTGNIREIVASTGIINTIVANTTPGYSGDYAHGVFVDGFGNIFFTAYTACDSPTCNSEPPTTSHIFELVAATGLIQTIAGSDTPGYSGDGGPATRAGLNRPSSVSVDGLGDVFFADTFNNRIREVVAATGIIMTVAGNGTYGYSGDSGPATSAELNFPNGVFVDQAGNIFIADSDNNRIREVVAATGIIQTVAGNGSPTFSGDNGPATNAGLAYPSALSDDSSGNLLIVDAGNARIRSVSHLLTVFPEADFSLAAAAGANCPAGGNCSTSATVNAGQTATYNLQASQIGGFIGIVALICSGAPSGSTCSISPGAISVSSSPAYAFTVMVSSTSSVLTLPWPPNYPATPRMTALFTAFSLFLTVFITLVCWKAVTKDHGGLTRRSVFVGVLIVAIIFSGCSSGNGTNQHPTNTTLTITGTSGSVKHQLNLSFTASH